MSRVRSLASGIAIAILAFAVIAGVVEGVWHIPRPAKKIEWVHSDASIIVQMKVNGFQFVDASGIDPYVIVPEFTLYGDGTLIASRLDSKCPCRLIEAKLSDDQVQNLLRYIDNTGFFDFTYVEPGGPDSAPTTYIYAALKDGQNISGRRYLLANCFRDCTPPPSHYRKLGEIQGRLKQIIEESISSGTATDYSADAIVLSAIAMRPTLRSTPPEWPFPQVDLATIASGSEAGSRRIEGELAHQVQQTLAVHPGETDYLVGAQWFGAGYRPILPHEENFPEFEPPTQ